MTSVRDSLLPPRSSVEDVPAATEHRELLGARPEAPPSELHLPGVHADPDASVPVVRNDPAASLHRRSRGVEHAQQAAFSGSPGSGTRSIPTISGTTAALYVRREPGRALRGRAQPDHALRSLPRPSRS